MNMFEIQGEPRQAAEARQLILESFNDLEFFEEGHVYMLNGKQLDSVSQIGKRFESRPFDSKTQAALYAHKHGNTPEHWLEQWNNNSLRATSHGSKVHAFGESLSYLRNGHDEMVLDSVRSQFSPTGELIPDGGKEKAVVKFLDDLPDCYHLVLNEAMVYSGKNPQAEMNLREQICGTFDMLYYYDGQGDEQRAGMVLMDYKTNQSLYSEYNQRNRIMLLPPFDDMVQEDNSLYTIQLSLYALMLEDIGLKMLGRRLIWLHENGEYTKVPVADVSDRLRNVL